MDRFCAGEKKLCSRQANLSAGLCSGIVLCGFIFLWINITRLVMAQQGSPEKSVTLQGIVFDGGWNVLPGAQVTLVTYDKECSQQTVTANQEGYYQLAGIPMRRHSLVVKKDGFAQVVAPIPPINSSEPQIRHHFLLPETKEKPAAPEKCPVDATSLRQPASLKNPYIKQSKILYQPRTNYPATAKAQRIEGDVIIEVVLNHEGRISTLRPLFSPHPELTIAAERNVQQWRYSPTLMDGKPVEVVFTATVNFTLRR